MGSSGGGGGLTNSMFASDPSGHFSAAYGAYNSAEGAARSARAAGDAAEAQRQEAGQAFGMVKDIVNPTTVAGLANYDKSIAQQEKNISRQEQLISQIDPTIIEASQQALKLLRGESSSTLAPIQAQRQQQREKLMNSLVEQMGPGAATSTAGMQALTKFDAETNNMLSGQQQQALMNLGSLSGQFSAQRPDMMNQIGMLSNLYQGKTDLGFKQANALFQARQPMLGTAGAQFAGDLLSGQYQQAAGNQMMAAGQQTQSQNKQMMMQMMGSMGMMSDARAKRDIIKLTKSVFKTVPTYIFRYLDSDDWKIGTMAQDLLALDPKHPAVSVGDDGLYRVNYAEVP